MASAESELAERKREVAAMERERDELQGKIAAAQIRAAERELNDADRHAHAAAANGEGSTTKHPLMHPLLVHVAADGGGGSTKHPLLRCKHNCLIFYAYLHFIVLHFVRVFCVFR